MLIQILMAFIPVFVAVDAIGVLPIFVSLTQQCSPAERNRIIRQSIFTAVFLAVFFITLGKLVFRFLGITMGDFMIAGGTVLFFIALNDILTTGKRQRMPVDELGAVPLGTPLIVGPAVLTTSLMIVDQYGITATLISVVVNVFLAAFIFSRADALIKMIGRTGARALSKIMALFLAAIAVMMIRKGLILVLRL